MDRPATDASGRRIADVLVMDTATGPTPHLVTSVDRKGTLCGRTPARISRTWFDLTGCQGCRRAAIKAGIATITDVDGRVITL